MRDYPVPDPSRTIDGRTSMRSVADAIDRLRLEKQFFADSFAQIRTAPIQLPTGEFTMIVLVIGEPRTERAGPAVALPSSNIFIGKPLGGNPQRFESSRLDRAWVDDTGLVELSDGTLLKAVEVVPTRLCRELSEIQKRIVYWTIKCINAERDCYRALPDTGWAGLDYAAIRGRKLPGLKKIAYYIAKHDPTLKTLAHQTIANALSVCGMRQARCRRLAARSR